MVAVDRTDEALAALARRDWSDAEVVDDRPRKASFVHSVRMPAELTDRLFAEAQRRQVTPSEVIRDLVEAGLAEAEGSATVRLADVRRALDRLARPAAA